MAQEEQKPPAAEEESFVELDLDKTVTWTGNSVSVQAGTSFSLPLTVPTPSVLAIQFEVEGGLDVDFSLAFKDDNEDEAVQLVDPVRVSDREGQLDIDCTGICYITWDNKFSWLNSKNLSYQLQLAPKMEETGNSKARFRKAVIAASKQMMEQQLTESAEETATSFADIVVEAMKKKAEHTAEVAKLEANMQTSLNQAAEAEKTQKENVAKLTQLEENLVGYMTSQGFTEEQINSVLQPMAEMMIVRQAAEQAVQDVNTARMRAEETSRELELLNFKGPLVTTPAAMDSQFTSDMLQLLMSVKHDLNLIFSAYAGVLSDSSMMSAAEFIFLLQDFEILDDADISELMLVLDPKESAMSFGDFVMCMGRAALALKEVPWQVAGEQLPIVKVQEILKHICTHPPTMHKWKLTQERRANLLKGCEGIKETFFPTPKITKKKDKTNGVKIKAKR